jgi:hypothetical protein
MAPLQIDSYAHQRISGERLIITCCPFAECDFGTALRKSSSQLRIAERSQKKPKDIGPIAAKNRQQFVHVYPFIVVIRIEFF